jgi:hypothetical protein
MVYGDQVFSFSELLDPWEADDDGGADDGGEPAAGSVLLHSETPQEDGGMSFSYSGAAFDSYYTSPPHWKITSSNGYVEFTFSGKQGFSFHALGSTSGGVSYCYVAVSVNGEIYWPDEFIDASWEWYEIPSSALTAGQNVVRITLTGYTHFWIDEARTE